MPEAILECGDYSEFQDALKSMRKADDIIVSTINSVVPTGSFHVNENAACESLYKSLEEGHTRRERTIKNCISVTTDRLKQLKEQRAARQDDMQLSKSLRSEQTKLRMLQVELSVEDMIQQRTTKVLSEKCRSYFKPS